MASTQSIKTYLYGFLLSTISCTAFDYLAASPYQGIPRKTLSGETVGELSSASAPAKKATLTGLDYSKSPLSGLVNLLLIFLLLAGAVSLRKLWELQTFPLPLQQSTRIKKEVPLSKKNISLADIEAEELTKIAIKVMSTSNEKPAQYTSTSYLELDSTAAQAASESSLSIQK